MITFKRRVSEFWQWYLGVAQRFQQTIDSGHCSELADEVSEVVERLFPSLGWAFGPGEDGGHAFTLTGEGQIAKQLLAEYWHAAAPVIPHWTFHASRQAIPIEQLRKSAITVAEGEKVDAGTFLVRTEVNDEDEEINLVGWHPALESVPEEHHVMILFVLLDEALGEFGTEMWLGEIRVAKFDADAKTRSIAELPEFISQVRRYHEWKKLPPLESYTLYQMKDLTDVPRGDSVVGASCIASIVLDYIDRGGVLEQDPIADSGAELIYLAIDGDVFPPGEQADVRGKIDDALSDVLDQHASGRTLGGAFGIHLSYIELILFDGPQSREIIVKTLADLQLHGRYRIESFVPPSV